MPYSNIDKPSKYFDSLAYSGNSTTRSITDLNFKPDLLWIKSRSNATVHLLFDAVRGVSKRLISNLTNAESTETAISSFDTNGWTMDGDTANNGTGRTYVAWTWLGANTTVSNTSGTITSTVSANTTSGFSIVSWTGNATNSTIGHGLGVTPALILSKNRTDVDNWSLWHQRLSATSGKYMTFNDTGAEQTDSTIWNTAPTSTVFGVGTNNRANGNGDAMIAYCFAEVKGFSKFGSYTGNGSTDGTFVYTGFKPAYVMIKQTNTSGNDWYVYDNKRETYNFMNNILRPNTADADTITTVVSLDFLSNGIKMRGTNTGMNGSGSTYIYMAFAENPFVSSKSIPTTAR
jgi:hypothetical protein